MSRLNFLFSKYSFGNNIRVSNSLYPDQAQCSVEADQGQNCLHLGYQQQNPSQAGRGKAIHNP